MNIAISTDEHTYLVDRIIENVQRRGHTVKYFGPPPGKTSDWPDVTRQATEYVSSQKADEAIVMCWTGTGCSIAANKIPGIRAALCADAETARGARIWNHANVLSLSLRSTSEAVAKEILEAWFAPSINEDEWNLQQIKKIEEIEQPYNPRSSFLKA